MSRPPNHDRDGKLLHEEPRKPRIQLSNASSVCEHTIMLALRNLFTNTWSFYKRDSADGAWLVSVSERLDVLIQDTMTGRRWEERCSLSEVRGQRWWHLSCSSSILPCFLTSFLLLSLKAHPVSCWLTSSLLFTFSSHHPLPFRFGSSFLVISSSITSSLHIIFSILICLFSSHLISSLLF